MKREFHILIKTAPFPIDSEINIWGVYSRLMVKCSRVAPQGKTTSEYFLVPTAGSYKGLKKLTKGQYLRACELLFFRAADEQTYEGPDRTVTYNSKL